MNINFQAVIKAGAVGVVVGGILAIMGQIPFLSVIAALISCCTGFLIPITVGLLYGYFSPGEETLGESAAGGALSAVVGGVISGVLGIVTFIIVQVVAGADVVAALTAGAVSLAFTVCGTPIFSAIMGAIGGAIWTVVQNRK